VPRVLHKLRIDEISLCDRGAGEGTRVALYKRNDASSTKKKATDMADHFVEVCKRLGDGDPSIIPPSEHEMFEHIQKYASEHRRHGETAAGAFNRVFNEQTDEGLALRRAVNVCKRRAGFPL
jgi:hypothetical protein